MVEKLISLIKNRAIVLLVSACLFGWGIYSVQENPIDAIPDQKIRLLFLRGWIEAQVIEDQVTTL
jgi:Cu(I)/Ag(I) efflux system membrane protein CusA/SilA